MKNVECIFCGYKWTARIDNPKQCPLCKRYQFKHEVMEKLNGTQP